MYSAKSWGFNNKEDKFYSVMELTNTSEVINATKKTKQS